MNIRMEKVMSKEVVLSMLQKQLSKEEMQRIGAVSYPDRIQLLKTLTFDKRPSVDELERVADKVAEMALMWCKKHGVYKVLIGGANYLTPMLVHSLLSVGLVPVFVWIERELVGFADVGKGKTHGQYKSVIAGIVEPYTLDDALLMSMQ